LATDRHVELDAFAEALMRLVRDSAIASSMALASGEVRGLAGDRWRALAVDARTREALRELVPEIVDQTLFSLLDAIDNDRLSLAVQGSAGTWLPLADLGLGEMAGWLAGGDWPRRFSTQPWHD
jgi:hypothetical protein